MTNESDLVPLHMHNLLTAGPAPWTDTRVPSEVWHVARAVYGTSTEDDEKRVYRTLQAALWKLAAPQPEAQPQWQPIETAPTAKGARFIGLTRSGRAVTAEPGWYVYEGPAVQRGWVEVERGSIVSVELINWMPLPAAPSAQAEPAKCISTNPNAQRPYRPDDFCPDMACGILGQCRLAGQAEPQQADTVTLVGVKADGTEHVLGTATMPPKMKARELVREMFGSIDEETGDDGAMALWVCEQLIEWMQETSLVVTLTNQAEQGGK